MARKKAKATPKPKAPPKNKRGSGIVTVTGAGGKQETVGPFYKIEDDFPKQKKE
jgi:hypothetical protein